MSDDKKDLGDKAEDAFDKAKNKAKETADKAKSSAKEAADDAKDAAKDFSNEAKKTADEFSEGFKSASGENKKLLAGILAIVLGGFGIHKFILGYTKEGIIMLVATLVLGVLTCGIAGWVVWIVGLIEGILYLTKSDEEFYNTYQVGRKPWF